MNLLRFESCPDYKNKPNMTINVGDIITTQVGGPYKVISVSEGGLVTFRMKNGIGMTIVKFVISVKRLAK
jgi:uncharacterized protein YodC (DUF2158 family)